MNRFKFAILAVFFSVASIASAEYYEREGNYVYKVSPYTELWSTMDGVKVTAKVATKVLVSVLDSMKANKILPDAIVSREDLERFRKSQSDMDALVDYLNEFVREQRARGGKLEKVDALPDALVFFGGQKFSVNVGKGAGVSGSVGLVVMPVWVEKYDARTGKLLEEGASLRASVVVWPAADAGFGIGGGARARLGVGAIWDLNDAFVNPEQFWGAGFGTSWSPITFGAGINVKVGVLSNWQMPGWVDFAYASAAFEFGPTAELGSPRINLTTVISGPAFMGLFDKAHEQAYKDVIKDMSKKMDEFMREVGSQLPRKGKRSDGEGAEIGLPEDSGKRVP